MQSGALPSCLVPSGTTKAQTSGLLLDDNWSWVHLFSCSLFQLWFSINSNCTRWWFHIIWICLCVSGGSSYCVCHNTNSTEPRGVALVSTTAWMWSWEWYSSQIDMDPGSCSGLESNWPNACASHAPIPAATLPEFGPPNGSTKPCWRCTCKPTIGHPCCELLTYCMQVKKKHSATSKPLCRVMISKSALELWRIYEVIKGVSIQYSLYKKPKGGSKCTGLSVSWGLRTV